ncbi:unnamed protein product [Paramecium sonneborni]|uniref:Uncharacterized protein n=1 Tax=Paramecium sonneborni TaxID=65129 RepID=A0A8S1K4Z2_9CILI|nr:unnamed protein product [Paramecium sonneborni]
MTEENKKPHLKKLLTFFTEAPQKTIQRTKTVSEAFTQHLTQPVTQVSKLKRFFTLSFAIIKGKTNEKMEKLQSNLQKSQNDENHPNSFKVSSTEKMNIVLKKDNEQNEDKNQQKVEHSKRCITPQSRIDNNCNSSLAISQLEDQLIDRNAASFANMTLELSMNTNVLQQMALPSKETNLSHRELNFDAISNPILEKSQSQENLILEQNQDGIIEQEQITNEQNQQINKNTSQKKFQQTVNLVQTFNIVTGTYRHKQKLLNFFQEAPIKIALKTKFVFQQSKKKLIKDPQFNNVTSKDERKQNNNNQLNDQILVKENNIEHSFQQANYNKIDNSQQQQQQGLVIQQEIQDLQLDQQDQNTIVVQNNNQNNSNIENDSQKHQKSLVNFIQKSGTLMKKKTIEMFQSIENKFKFQEEQKIHIINQQVNIEKTTDYMNQSNKNLLVDKGIDNQSKTELQNQNQNSDQDEYEYQVDPSLVEELKISKQNTNEKQDEFNYKDENSNLMNDSQANSNGEFYSNDKLPQEITHIEKKSFHQDSFDTSQMFDIIQKSQDTQSQNQKSKINIQDNQSNQLTSKLFNKDELRQQYEEINQEIQQLNLEKQQLLPKKNVLIKSTFKPNYKKMADISDDNEALYKAKDLIRKMNQKRKDKEERTKKQNEKIEEYFHNLQYLKESQEEMKNRYEFQRKQQIQNRIEDYQKKQKEFSQLQKISHNFVQKLINVGPQQGQLAKEFEDNVISIKGGYRKVKLKNLGIELPKINGNNNNVMFRRYMNEELVKSKQDEMIRKYEASKQALFKSSD